MEACLGRLQPGCRAPHSARAVFPFLVSPSAFSVPLADAPSLFLRRRVLTPRTRASEAAGITERCARPPGAGSGGGGSLCALAHARSPSNSGLNCRGPGGGRLFFSFRARTRGISSQAFSCRVRASARARSLLASVSLRGAGLGG